MEPICMRIILTGEAGVGKTALINRFVNGVFVPSVYRPSLGMDVEERKIMVDGREVQLQVWDTVGQERFRAAIPPMFFRQSNVVVFVFDVTRPQTLDSWGTWSDLVRSNLSEDEIDSIPFVAMANKIDLTNVQRLDLHKAIWKQAMGGIKCYRTSAKDDSCDLDSIFVEIARYTLTKMDLHEDDHNTATLPVDYKTPEKKKTCCGR